MTISLPDRFVPALAVLAVVALPVSAMAQSLVPIVESTAQSGAESSTEPDLEDVVSVQSDEGTESTEDDGTAEEGAEDGAEETAGASAIDLWNEDPTRFFEASEISLSDLEFLTRPVVVFANSPNDPQFLRQMDLLTARVSELVIRDVIVITDTDPANASEVRRTLRPRGFQLALIDKDGRVSLRKPEPWDVRELTRSIDQMPSRRQEIRDGRG